MHTPQPHLTLPLQSTSLADDNPYPYQPITSEKQILNKKPLQNAPFGAHRGVAGYSGNVDPSFR
ncbi:MAG TPA: hypothetical protein GXX42_04985 [Petrimonas sp.]|uniref:hypothetical protein n=1 Tax=Petrimonas sp. TaxID=2023866 RepID=UPI00176FC22E|nr:hypothetical protein [Petrimonas sp.]